jgi:site-specific DNA-cytosine methylase
MTALYNEIEPFAVRWLDNLITEGHIANGRIEPRSIWRLRASDVAGATQAHFFAGIGVWSYALRLAGWPDDAPVWTGSCPCQPFSQAGAGGLAGRARQGVRPRAVEGRRELRLQLAPDDPDYPNDGECVLYRDGRGWTS